MMSVSLFIDIELRHVMKWGDPTILGSKKRSYFTRRRRQNLEPSGSLTPHPTKRIVEGSRDHTHNLEHNITDPSVAGGNYHYGQAPISRSSKCMKSCPRCIEMTRRIETLFRNHKSDREADLCEIFSCPPCADLVDKFRKFTAEDDILKREHDSELIHLQRLTSPSQNAFDTARARFEDLVMGGAKDDKRTKKEIEIDNKLTNKEKANAKDLKTKTSKLPKLSDKRSKDATEGTVKDKGRTKKESDVGLKDLKAKSTEAQKSLGNINNDAMSKVGNIDSKKEKTGKTPKAISESKITKGITKEPSITSKSATKLKSLSAETNPLIRMKIADHMHNQEKINQAQRKHALQLNKQKKDIDDKLNRANKLEEEAKIARARAEEARQLKFMAAMQYDGPSDPSSGDRGTDVCSDESAVYCMIKGNKIVKASAVERVETPIAAVLPSITSRSSVAPAHPPPKTNSNTPDRNLCDAHLRYNLSERKYVNKGWTLLPKEMVMRKVTLFHMHPARNECDWLEMNRHKERVMYDSGEQLATFDENGCARVYYRSGVLALDFYQAQEKNAGGYRVVVYSNTQAADCGRAPSHTVLAAFDYSGNGEVFDHVGRPRLKYSQNDGVVLDRNIGPYTHWKWHNLNDAGRLQTVLIENEPLHKDPKIIHFGEELVEPGTGKRGKTASRGDNKSTDKSITLTSRGSDKSINPGHGQGIELDEPISNDEMIMRAVESENVIKENCRLLKGFSPYQIKMKAFKINDNFSLRIIHQASVFLTFSDGKTRFRINVGMVMDPTVVLGQDLVEVGEVKSSLETIPASESLEELQRVVRGARTAERARVLREERLNPPVSSDSPLPSIVKGRSHMH